MDRIYRVGIDEVPKRLTLEENEHLRLTFIVMPGVSAEVPFEIKIGKPGVHLEIFGLYLSPRNEQVRFDFTVRHLVGGAHSSQQFRGIVGGTARAEFDGLSRKTTPYSFRRGPWPRAVRSWRYMPMM